MPNNNNFPDPCQTPPFVLKEDKYARGSFCRSREMVQISSNCALEGRTERKTSRRRGGFARTTPAPIFFKKFFIPYYISLDRAFCVIICSGLNMKPETKRIIKNIAKGFAIDLLEFIEDNYNLIPKRHQSLQEYWRVSSKAWTNLTSNQVSRGFYYLKKQKLIEKKTIAKRETYQLTIRGKQRLLMAKIHANKKNPRDGTSCIVIFDIPEEKKKHRQFLRRLLLKNGFMNLQRSVLIGPEFLSQEFFELLEDLKLRQNVSVIKGKVMHV